MKILYIVPNVIGLKNFFRTGALIDEGMPSMFKPMKYLIQNNHRITILVYPHYVPIIEQINYKNKNLTIKSLHLKSELLLSKIIRKLSLGYINLHPFFEFVSLVRQILNIRKELDFKLIYGQDNLGVLTGYLLGKILNKPVISRIYGASFMRASEGKVSVLAKIKHWAKYLPLKVRTELLIITKDGSLSDLEIQKIKPKAKKVRLWFNGYDNLTKKIEPIDNNDKKYDFTLISISVLSKWKNVDVCIKVLNKLIEKGYNCNLIVIGSGQEKSNLIKLADSYNILGNISFVGNIKRKSIYNYLESSHVFLNFYERQNLSNTLWEAMSMSKCVFTRSEYKINRELLTHGENAYLLPIDDIDRIVDELANLYSNRDLLRQVGFNARKTVKNIITTWEKRVIQEYEEIINIYNSKCL